MKDFSIIMPTKDRGEIFYSTLAKVVEASRDYNAEIIVVNDSVNPLHIPSEYNTVVLVDNPRKNSVARAMNYGVKHSSSDNLIFMGDDIVISKKNIERVFEFRAAHPNTVLNLNWIYPPELSEKIKKEQFGRFLQDHELDCLKGWRKGLIWKDNEVFEAETIANYFLLLDKKLFYEVGAYNEDFPFAGGEDSDLSAKLSKKGLKLFIDPFETVYHNEAEKTKLKVWLARKRMSGLTYRKASQMGYKEYYLEYSAFKKLVLTLVLFFRPLLFLFLKLIPNKVIFDKLYFKIVDVLLAASIYEGYTSE
jgi:glycosyltransferase involved in cell wall biosynthesis